MSQQQHDEIDLVYVIGKLKKTVKNWISLAFKGIDYALKYWYVILILAIIGFAIGFYQMKDRVNPKKANVIVRINYELQSYVLNSLELYNAKAKMHDSTYLTKIGLNRWDPQIKEILAEPIVDFKDIFEEYDVNERSLEMLLKTVNFESDEATLSDFFVPKYNFFDLDFSLTGKATEDDVKNFIKFLNEDESLLTYKIEARKNLEEVIAHNKKSIVLIDTILQSYVGLGANTPSNVLIEKDLDLNRLMESKLIIQKQNEKLKNNLVLSNNIVVPIHDIQIREGEGRLLGKKHIVYPIFFVFSFLFLSYLRYLYFYFRSIAREVNN